MSTTKIKICGLFRACDAVYINEAKPDYAGFIFYKKSHRYVDFNRAQKLRREITESIKTVGVFVDHELKDIKNIYENKIIDIVQLHGHEDENYIRKLREIMPKVEVWKAFLIKGEKDILKAEKCSADKVLLDNGYGTGECFDWSKIKNINRDIVLAGGLNETNLKEAIKSFSPEIVDISSGVETNKFKDRDKILTAVNLVRETN